MIGTRFRVRVDSLTCIATHLHKVNVATIVRKLELQDHVFTHSFHSAVDAYVFYKLLAILHETEALVI